MWMKSGYYYAVVALLFANGCGNARDPFSREVTDKSGKHKLLLQYKRAGQGPAEGSEAWEFKELAWSNIVGGKWVCKLSVSRAAFSASGDKGIQDIYTFDPLTGNAIIKVAELSQPQTNGAVVHRTMIYSWREWNLLTNGEVRVIRVCGDPVEPFIGRQFKVR